MLEALDMGKYAAYVWPSYGVTLVVLVGLLVWTLKSAAAAKRRVDQLDAMGRPRRRAGGEQSAASGSAE